MQKMSKLFLATSMALVLAACGDTQTDGEDLTTGNEQTEESTSDEMTSTDSVETDEEVSEDDMAAASEEELDNTEVVSDHENYEELPAQDYFNPADFTSHLLTDNPGTRVFIFEDGSEQAYKTVFVKRANRLKVIDLIHDELLTNEIIN